MHEYANERFFIVYRCFGKLTFLIIIRIWNGIFQKIAHQFLNYKDRYFKIADIKLFESYGDLVITTNKYDETKIIVWNFEDQTMSLKRKTLYDIDLIAV